MTDTRSDTELDGVPEMVIGAHVELADDTPFVAWRPAPTAQHAVVATAANLTGDFTIHWGDGSSADSAVGAAPVKHVYPGVGVYAVTVEQGGQRKTQAGVGIRDGLAPNITVAARDDNPNIIEVTFNDEPVAIVSHYHVQWVKDGPTETVVGVKGTRITHGYAAGTYEFTVADMLTRRHFRQQLTVVDKTYDPDFTIAQGANDMTVDLTVSAAAEAKDLLIDWGGGSQATIPAPGPGGSNVGQKRSHTFASADTYIVQLVYSNGSTDGSARTVVIPFPAVA